MSNRPSSNSLNTLLKREPDEMTAKWQCTIISFVTLQSLPSKVLITYQTLLFMSFKSKLKMITCKFLKKQNFQFSKLVISDYSAQQKTKLFPLLEADHLLGPRCPKALPFSVFLDLKAGILPTRCFASFEEKNVFFSPVLQLFHSRRFIFICQPFSF